MSLFILFYTEYVFYVRKVFHNWLMFCTIYCMSKSTKASLYIFVLALFVSACDPTHNYQSPPVPSELLEDPFYKNQVDQFDEILILDRKLSDLIEDGRVSKEPNNTDPIIFNIERPEQPIEVLEENFNEDPNLYFEPSHDRIKVEEYFIDEDIVITGSTDEEPLDTTPDNSTTDTKEEKQDALKKNTSIEPVEGTSEDKPVQVSEPDLEEVESDKNASTESTEIEEQELFDADKGTFDKDTSVISASWDGRSYSSDYTNYLIEGIELFGKELLNTSKNINNAGFCPNYNNLNVNERMSFWVMFLSTVAKHESGFDTNAKYLEPRSGHYSRGLLQIGYNSSHLKPYSCGFETPYEMNTNPRKNLHCGVKILNYWIKKDKTIRHYKADGKRWLGAARYWSVVRFEIWQQAKKNRLTEIKTNTQKLPFCDIPT